MTYPFIPASNVLSRQYRHAIDYDAIPLGHIQLDTSTQDVALLKNRSTVSGEVLLVSGTTFIDFERCAQIYPGFIAAYLRATEQALFENWFTAQRRVIKCQNHRFITIWTNDLVRRHDQSIFSRMEP